MRIHRNIEQISIETTYFIENHADFYVSNCIDIFRHSLSENIIYHNCHTYDVTLREMLRRIIFIRNGTINI